MYTPISDVFPYTYNLHRTVLFLWLCYTPWAGFPDAQLVNRSTEQDGLPITWSGVGCDQERPVSIQTTPVRGWDTPQIQRRTPTATTPIPVHEFLLSHAGRRGTSTDRADDRISLFCAQGWLAAFHNAVDTPSLSGNPHHIVAAALQRPCAREFHPRARWWRSTGAVGRSVHP